MLIKIADGCWVDPTRVSSVTSGAVSSATCHVCMDDQNPEAISVDVTADDVATKVNAYYASQLADEFTAQIQSHLDGADVIGNTGDIVPGSEE